MGVKQYWLGLVHAKAGMAQMSHRKNRRRYDSRHAQESYDRGYSDGYRQYLKARNLDYNPRHLPVTTSVSEVATGWMELYMALYGHKDNKPCQMCLDTYLDGLDCYSIMYRD